MASITKTEDLELAEARDLVGRYRGLVARGILTGKSNPERIFKIGRSGIVRVGLADEFAAEFGEDSFPTANTE